MESLAHYLLIAGRAAIVYGVVFLGFRLAGKKHVAELSLVDFILILLVSDAVQSAMVGDDTSVFGGLIAGITLILVNVILTKLVVKSERVAKLIEGEPVLLVRNGRMLRKHLERENLRAEEVHEAMHKAGVAHVKDVAMAILETDGTISIIRADSERDQQRQEKRIP